MYIHIRAYICVYILMHICMCVCIYIYMYTRMYIHRKCIYAYVHMYKCIHLYVQLFIIMIFKNIAGRTLAARRSDPGWPRTPWDCLRQMKTGVLGSGRGARYTLKGSVFMYVSIYLFIYLSIYLSVYLCLFLPVCMHVWAWPCAHKKHIAAGHSPGLFHTAPCQCLGTAIGKCAPWSD